MARSPGMSVGQRWIVTSVRRAGCNPGTINPLGVRGGSRINGRFSRGIRGQIRRRISREVASFNSLLNKGQDTDDFPSG